MILKEEIIRILDYCNIGYTENQSIEDYIQLLRISRIHNKVNWVNVSMYSLQVENSPTIKLSEDFIREFKDQLNWLCISQFQSLSEDFIREFQYQVNWLEISASQPLFEDFIREFQGWVDWEYISEYQILSEDFIREFQYSVDWYCISMYQNLSDSFRKEFKI